MKTRKTNSNNRTTYKYTYFVPNKLGGYDEKTLEIKPGENGVTVADIKMLHSIDDREVYYNNKNLRPTRTAEEKAEIEAWKEEYIRRFNLKHGGSHDGAVIKHLQLSHVHRGILRAEDVGEALLGDAAVQRHLAALEAGALAAAGTGLGALVALTGGLAQTGAHASTEALGRSGGTRGGAQLMQFHWLSLLSP